MTKQTVVITRSMPVLARASSSVRLATVTKAEIVKGWEAAGDPQLLEIVRIADARDVADYTAQLIARRS